MQESITIQMSSAKLMNFFVHDILSLSQINSEKFRKNISLFNLESAISEVVSIFQMKASSVGVSIETKFHGFSKTAESKILVCTDEERLQ